METRRVQLCTQQKLRYLEIAHQCRAISRLCTGAAQSRDCVNPVHNLEIGRQFRDSENAQRNLEIAQIPRVVTNQERCLIKRIQYLVFLHFAVLLSLHLDIFLILLSILFYKYHL